MQINSANDNTTNKLTLTGNYLFVTVMEIEFMEEKYMEKTNVVSSLSASSLIGDNVFDNNGNKLGTVKDIMLNITTGDIHYFILAHKNNEETQHYAIPWNETKIDLQNKCFVVPTTKERLDAVPGLVDAWPDAYSKMWEKELMKFYDSIMASNSIAS